MESATAGGFRGNVHYIDEGEGPVLLFLHGSTSWSFLFRGAVIRLRKRFRCIAVDLPGFGLSEEPRDEPLGPEDHAEVLVGFLQALDLRDVVLVGHEWGGAIGMRVASDEIDRLSGLVLSNTFHRPLDGWRTKSFGWAMSTAAAQRSVVEGDLISGQLLPRSVVQPMDPRVVQEYREAFASPRRRRGSARLLRELTRARGWLEDLSDGVVRLLAHVPLLLAWGVRDPVFDSEMIDLFRDDFRVVRVSRLNAGHLAPEDAPGELSEAISRWHDECVQPAGQ